VRDALLQAALEQAQRSHAAAGSRLLLACLTGASLLLALSMLLLIVHRRVLRPLLWVTRALVNLGDGDLITEVRVPTRRDESACCCARWRGCAKAASRASSWKRNADA